MRGAPTEARRGGGATRLATVTIGVALVSLAAGVVGTLMLLPLWRWLEAATGIESIGHSGPAAWCYAATALAFFAVVESVVLVRGGARGTT
jgi:hypothetical protein